MDSTNISVAELANTLRREAHRKWQQENPEKTKAYRERYWLKKAEQLLEGKEAERQ